MPNPMRPVRICTLSAFALVVCCTASAASYSCKAARTPREKAICASPQLSAADDQMAAAYAKLRAGLSPPAAEEVQADQRAWLAYLDKACPVNGRGARKDMAACLAKEYGTREDDLKPSSLLKGRVVYTRAAYITVLNKPGDEKDLSGQDPGFGVLRFHWPQIDHADASEVLWNRGVYTFLLSRTATAETPHPRDLSETAESGESLDVDYVLRGANTHFLVTEFHQFFYGYGAVHPLTTLREFIWNLDAGHELRAQDVFKDASSWSKELAPAAYAKLKAMPYVGDALFDGVAKNLPDGLQHEEQWSPSCSSLRIRFDQYQVAAYVFGMPEIRFPWKELRPFLNPAFDPNMLPDLTPSPF
jgi:uncharacterized protein YecT (DUF1311 family)